MKYFNNNLETEDTSSMYLTLSDGTDISMLDYEYRKHLFYLPKREVHRFWRSKKTLELLEEKYAEDNSYSLPVGDYLFPKDEGVYFGYILQIRTFEKNNITYKYYDLAVGKTVKTIRAQTNDFKNPVTQTISNLFGIAYDEEELFNHLIRIAVKNTENEYGEVTFSKITKFRIVKPEAERALIECSKLLFEN